MFSSADAGTGVRDEPTTQRRTPEALPESGGPRLLEGKPETLGDALDAGSFIEEALAGARRRRGD